MNFFENLFEKKIYKVDTLALKWDLVTDEKLERRVNHFLRAHAEKVFDFMPDPQKIVEAAINHDTQILVKCLVRSLRQRGYLQINHPEVAFEPFYEFTPRYNGQPIHWEWLGFMGQYRFKVDGIKRDVFINERFPDLDTKLMLPEGQRTFELLVSKAVPEAFWTRKDIPR